MKCTESKSDTQSWVCTMLRLSSEWGRKHSITFWWNVELSVPTTWQPASPPCSWKPPEKSGFGKGLQRGRILSDSCWLVLQSGPADCPLKTCVNLQQPLCESAFRQKEVRKRKHWKPLSCWQDQWALRFLGHKWDRVRDHKYPWSQRLWQRGYRAHPGNGSVPAAQRMGPQLLDSSHPRMNHSFKGWDKFPYYPVFLLLQRELLRELLSEITRFK